MMQLQESFPFGDSGELFDTALKYANWRTRMSTKIFEPNIFVIPKALPIFTIIYIVTRKFGAIRNTMETSY